MPGGRGWAAYLRAHTDGLRWALTYTTRVYLCRHHAQGSARSPELVDGSEDHRRLGIDDEHRPRSHRSALALWDTRRSYPRAGTSSIHHPLDGFIQRRIDQGAARRARHEGADSICADLPRSLAGAASAY